MNHVLKLISLSAILAASPVVAQVVAQTVTSTGAGAVSATTATVGSTGGVGVSGTNTNTSGTIGGTGGVGSSSSAGLPGQPPAGGNPGLNTSHDYPGANTIGLVNPPPGMPPTVGPSNAGVRATVNGKAPVGTANIGTNVGANVGIGSTVTSNPSDPNGTNVTNADNSWNTQRAYWNANFASRPYYNSSRTYANYEPAYRYGVDLYNQNPGKTYEDLNQVQISKDWLAARGGSSLNWTDADQATRDAYNRMVEVNRAKRVTQ